MFYEMLYKQCPFEEKTIPRLLRLIERENLSFPTPLPEQVKILISGMLGKSPYQRFSWSELFDYFDRNFDHNG
jgi:serine/threonine protein kinase